MGRTSGVRFCYAYNQGSKYKTTPCQFTHVYQLCGGQRPKIKSIFLEKSERDRNTVNSAKLNEQLLGYDVDLRKYLDTGLSSEFALGCISTPTAFLHPSFNQFL